MKETMRDKNIKNEIINHEEYINLRKDYMRRHTLMALFGVLLAIILVVFCALSKNAWTNESILYKTLIYVGYGYMILIVLYITVTPLWKIDGLFDVGTIKEIYKIPISKNSEIIDCRYKYGVKVGEKMLLSSSLNSNKKQLFNIGDEVYIFNFKEERKYCFATKY